MRVHVQRPCRVQWSVVEGLMSSVRTLGYATRRGTRETRHVADVHIAFPSVLRGEFILDH